MQFGCPTEAVGASLTNGPRIPKIPSAQSVWCSLSLSFSQRTLCAGAGLVNNSIQIVCVFVCVVRHQGGPAVGSKGINRDPSSQPEPASLINTLSRPRAHMHIHNTLGVMMASAHCCYNIVWVCVSWTTVIDKPLSLILSHTSQNPTVG